MHLQRGDWERAQPLIERTIAALRTGNVGNLLAALASYAWVLAQQGESSKALDQLREGEQLIDRLYPTGPIAGGRWNDHSLGRACLLLGRLDQARSLGNRAGEANQSQLGFAAATRRPGRR